MSPTLPRLPFAPDPLRQVHVARDLDAITTVAHEADPQSVANGYMQQCETAAGVPFQLVAAPVQFDEEPAAPKRAPEFNEHGDAILADLGFDWDTIVDLKMRGITA